MKYQGTIECEIETLLDYHVYGLVVNFATCYYSKLLSGVGNSYPELLHGSSKSSSASVFHHGAAQTTELRTPEHVVKTINHEVIFRQPTLLFNFIARR